MSQFSFEPEIAEEVQHEHQQEDHAMEPETLALSADDFSALEERVLRAVNLVKRERLARTEAEERAGQAEERAAQAEAKLAEQAPMADSLQNEVTALRAERDQVRQRVERLLSQLDALEL